MNTANRSPLLSGYSFFTNADSTAFMLDAPMYGGFVATTSYFCSSISAASTSGERASTASRASERLSSFIACGSKMCMVSMRWRRADTSRKVTPGSVRLPYSLPSRNAACRRRAASASSPKAANASSGKGALSGTAQRCGCTPRRRKRRSYCTAFIITAK